MNLELIFPAFKGASKDSSADVIEDEVISEFCSGTVRISLARLLQAEVLANTLLLLAGLHRIGTQVKPKKSCAIRRLKAVRRLIYHEVIDHNCRH
jgi:hypothetical protein